MEANELKHHIVETYGLQPEQVWVDFIARSKQYQISLRRNNGQCVIWCIWIKGVPIIDIDGRDNIGIDGIDETIKLLQIAKSIIESGVLDSRKSQK